MSKLKYIKTIRLFFTIYHRSSLQIQQTRVFKFIKSHKIDVLF